MNKQIKCVLSLVMAIVILALSLPTVSIAADNSSAANTALQNENSIKEDIILETADSTGIEYEEAFPLESVSDELITEIPSIGNIDNEGPSVELQDYTTITSAIVPDGVYALRNAGNADTTGRWMDMALNSKVSGTHIQQYAYTESPAETFDRAALFKISRVGTTDRYIIRSMLNNFLSFGFVENDVLTKMIPPNDTDVGLADTFTITRSGAGYVIKPYGSSYAVSAKNSLDSGLAGVPGSYLTKRTPTEAGTRAIWIFEKYTGNAQTGVTYSANPSIANGLTVGKDSTITVYPWTTVINAHIPTCEIPSAFEGTAECVATSAKNQFKLTGMNAGKSRLYFRMRYGNGTLLATYQIDFLVTPPIVEGVPYFMQNVATERYVDIQGPSTAEGAIIQQADYSTATNKKWIFEKQAGGYYTIRSVYSGLYIGSDSTTQLAVRQYSTINDYTKWYFVGTSSGNYALHNKGRGDLYALASMTASAGSGTRLVLPEYTDDSVYRDEWIVTMLPCSGSEVTYDPLEWNNNPDVKKNSNCYNYALNKKNSDEDEYSVYFFMQPGKAVGQMVNDYVLLTYENSIPVVYLQLKSPSTIQSYAIADSNYFGNTFEPIGKYEVCPEGTYKIALVMDIYDDPNILNDRDSVFVEGLPYIFENPDTDYHWYRQNPDGTWSHKPGEGSVIDTDAVGDVIYDPESCDREYSNVDYSVFVGFFAVSSLD